MQCGRGTYRPVQNDATHAHRGQGDGQGWLPRKKNTQPGPGWTELGTTWT